MDRYIDLIFFHSMQTMLSYFLCKCQHDLIPPPLQTPLLKSFPPHLFYCSCYPPLPYHLPPCSPVLRRQFLALTYAWKILTAPFPVYLILYSSFRSQLKQQAFPQRLSFTTQSKIGLFSFSIYSTFQFLTNSIIYSLCLFNNHPTQTKKAS